MNAKELYDAVRGIWRGSLNTIRKRNIEYVFGVYNQLIVAVYAFPFEMCPYSFCRCTIDLLKPTKVTAAGYRLHDEVAIEKLYMILVFRELGLSLKEIADILHAPDYGRNRVWEKQIRLMQERIGKLQDWIALAKEIIYLYIKKPQ